MGFKLAAVLPRCVHRESLLQVMCGKRPPQTVSVHHSQRLSLLATVAICCDGVMQVFLKKVAGERGRHAVAQIYLGRVAFALTRVLDLVLVLVLVFLVKLGDRRSGAAAAIQTSSTCVNVCVCGSHSNMTRSTVSTRSVEWECGDTVLIIAC